MTTFNLTCKAYLEDTSGNWQLCEHQHIENIIPVMLPHVLTGPHVTEFLLHKIGIVPPLDLVYNANITEYKGYENTCAEYFHSESGIMLEFFWHWNKGE